MNPPTKNYVFGPVPSRRIGRSLGVDLVPFKTCTYDCIYCQLGSTTNLTLERKEWVPMDVVLDPSLAVRGFKPSKTDFFHSIKSHNPFITNKSNGSKPKCSAIISI